MGDPSVSIAPWNHRTPDRIKVATPREGKASHILPQAIDKPKYTRVEDKLCLAWVLPYALYSSGADLQNLPWYSNISPINCFVMVWHCSLSYHRVWTFCPDKILLSEVGESIIERHFRHHCRINTSLCLSSNTGSPGFRVWCNSGRMWFDIAI